MVYDDLENCLVKHYIEKAKMKSPYVIWTYWESRVKGFDTVEESKPSHIRLCNETMWKHCSDDFLLAEMTRDRFIRMMKLIILDRNVNFNMQLRQVARESLGGFFQLEKDGVDVTQKSDLIRISLLTIFGGIWSDSDIIFLTSPASVLSGIQKFSSSLSATDSSERLVSRVEFVSFGCYGENECRHIKNGKTAHSAPANWFMVAMFPGTRTFLVAHNHIQALLAETSQSHSRNEKHLSYHSLGTNLWETVYRNEPDLLKRSVHANSSGVERDHDGNKFTNARLLGTDEALTSLEFTNFEIPEVPDRYIPKTRFILPMYNTAPGFAVWFHMLSEEEILQGPYLISKIYRQALSVSVK